jgi:hypothetical protein
MISETMDPLVIETPLFVSILLCPSCGKYMSGYTDDGGLQVVTCLNDGCEHVDREFHIKAPLVELREIVRQHD